MAASGIKLLSPPPINDPILIAKKNEDEKSTEFSLSQQWQDYFNTEWAAIQALIKWSNT